MKVSKRVAWVDYAKGLAIIGVFVLHSNAPEYVIHVVDMFCMPAFFLLSGFVFSIRKYGSFRPFLWNKLRTLVFPGLFFVIVPFAVERLVGTILGDAWSLNAYVKWLAGYIINMRGHEGYGNVPWFLACLFLVEIGGYVLLRLSERLWDSEWVFMVFGAISIFIGYAYSKFIHIVLPWGGDVALSMFGFFIFGYVLRGYRDQMERVLRLVTIIPAAVLLIVMASLNTRQPVNVYMNQYGNLVYYLVGAFCGLWLLLSICIGLSRLPKDWILLRIISYWDRNTLVFYCVNASIYVGLIPLILGRFGIETEGGSIGNQLLCMVGAIVINLVICSVVAEIMNRWLPGVLGRGDSNLGRKIGHGGCRIVGTTKGS